MSSLPADSDEFLDACLPGTSPQVLELKICIKRLNTQADEVRSVLIVGETGAGKTHIAKLMAMHRCWSTKRFVGREKLSPSEILNQQHFYTRTRGKNILADSNEPYREVPLPVLEGALAQSRLFGHARGAFTGANKPHTGFLGDPTVTDVLLDEIGYASVEMQRNLLQVIQSGTFYRLGETKERTTTARLFFATNQQLQKLVEERKFQEDLWWRLTDHILYLPPLRDRREEIPLIAKNLISDLNKQLGQLQGGDTDKSGGYQLSSQDLEWAKIQKWTGNIRELEKTVRRWFFFRGTRPLSEIWTQVQEFVPHPENDPQIVAVNKSKMTTKLRAILENARTTKTKLGSADDVVGQSLEAARKQTAGLLCSCLDAMDLNHADLQQMFTVKPESIRSWKSRSRIQD